MAEARNRRGSMTVLRVLRTEQLTPRMVRVVAGGEQLADFNYGGFTDSYVKLLFPKDDVDYPAPFDIAQIREAMPRAQWPDVRTYTVRALDKATGELTLDFVTHGDTGLAGPWAMAAKPGDEVFMLGPGGAYRPQAEVDWHLFAGDESALPAIAGALEALPAGARAQVVIEVAEASEEQPLRSAAELTVQWLHRDGAAYGEKLVDAVRALDWAPGEVQAFVHGETNAVKRLRGLLRDERGVSAELLSISGYWRIGMNEDSFQEAKRADR